MDSQDQDKMVGSQHSHQRRIGVIGLGAGTLAAYSREDRYIRFYEIDPAVVQLSTGPRPTFTYLSRAKGSIDIAMGDARLSLEREAARGEFGNFDVLVVDAFSDDAVPVHLLTREAMNTYVQHLRGPDSIIAVHISSKSLDLGEVVVGLAREFGFTAVRVFQLENDARTGSFPSDWVLMSRNPQKVTTEAITKHGYFVPLPGTMPLWTDDYSNLIQLVRMK